MDDIFKGIRRVLSRFLPLRVIHLKDQPVIITSKDFIYLKGMVLIADWILGGHEKSAEWVSL